MKLFTFFKQKKPGLPKLSPDQVISRRTINQRHVNRIKNLEEEFDSLSNELKEAEFNSNMTKVEREKLSDHLVRRMTFIKHEIEIRRGLLKWL